MVKEAWQASVDPRSWGHRITWEDVAELLEERSASAIVARVGETPAGCVLAVPTVDGKTVEVQKLAVLPPYRGSRIASALIEEVERFALGLRATQLLLAVSAYQPRLLQMYARMGFVVQSNAPYENASPNGRRPVVMTRPVGGTGSSLGRPDLIGEAVQALRRGGLVVLPTETVYGLGANASDPLALRRVFATKGRPVDHPLIVHLADGAQLDDWAVDVPEAARTLASVFWPGPLTLVLRRAGHVPDEVTGGRDTVALRVPNHPVALAVLGLFDGGIAAPSANRFGRVSPTTADDVRTDLGEFLIDGLDVVLDGGPSIVGVESTIIELIGDEPQLLRPGGLPVEEIEAAIQQRVRRIPTGPSRAPGMHAAHYAPSAAVRVTTIDSVASALAGAATPVGFLGPEAIELPFGVFRLEAPAPYSAETVAPVLYRSLRIADQQALATLVVVAPEGDGLGPAVRDRLARAETGSGAP